MENVIQGEGHFKYQLGQRKILLPAQKGDFSETNMERKTPTTLSFFFGRSRMLRVQRRNGPAQFLSQKLHMMMNQERGPISSLGVLVVLGLLLALVRDSKSQMVAEETSRNLVGLQEKFVIIEPSFAYENLQFDLEYTVNDAMNETHVLYKVFDGDKCKEYAKEEDGGGSNGTNTTSRNYLTSLLRPDLKPIGTGNGTRTMKVTVILDAETITDSPIYDNLGDYGMIKFCVRFGVSNMDILDANSLEVNFLETEIHLLVHLVDDFVDEIVQLSNIANLTGMSGQGTAVLAYVCDNDMNTIEVDVINRQGENIRVCVTATEETISEGAFLRHIEAFSFSKGEDLVQWAILPGTMGAPADSLTTVDCLPGSELCAFETILKADFFTDGDGVVTAGGMAFLQFGRGVPVIPEGEVVRHLGKVKDIGGRKHMVKQGLLEGRRKDESKTNTRRRSLIDSNLFTTFKFEIHPIPFNPKESEFYIDRTGSTGISIYASVSILKVILSALVLVFLS